MWISDHFQPWRHTGGRAPFSPAWLAAVGERTQRVLLATSVLTPTFRYHPSVMAHAFATLACLYPGRAALGIGSGEAMNEVAPTGMAWPEFKERYARLRESVSLMRQLWSSDFVTFAGTYYKTSTATLYDRPAEGVPVYIAAGGPQVCQVCRTCRQWLHLHKRQRRRAVSGPALTSPGRRRKGVRPRSQQHGTLNRDKGLVRLGSRPGVE